MAVPQPRGSPNNTRSRRSNGKTTPPALAACPQWPSPEVSDVAWPRSGTHPPPTNERLEFLGDSVLGLVVTDTLYRGYPNLPEGQLAKLRAAVVQMGALAEVARELSLGAYVRLGRGEQVTGGRNKPSILADTLEAVIGAVYIDCGLDEARALVHRLFDPVIARSARLGAGLDWKT